MNRHALTLVLTCAAALTGVTACSAPSTAPALPAIAAAQRSEIPRSTGPRAQWIYVAGDKLFSNGSYRSSLAIFWAASKGETKPSTLITGDGTSLYEPNGIGVDARGDIWTCNGQNNDILEFAVHTTGDSPPAKTIAGLNVPMEACAGLTLDKHANVYVSSYNFGGPAAPVVASWRPHSNGNVAPWKMLTGSKTRLDGPEGLAVTPAGRLWVVNQGSASISAFDSSQSGDAAPVARIAGSKTGLVQPAGLALDPSTQNLLVSDYHDDAIDVFAATANGNVAPLVRLTGNKTQIVHPFGIGMDAAGYIYVGNCPDELTQASSILVFAPGSNGNVAPVAAIHNRSNFSCFAGLAVTQ